MAEKNPIMVVFKLIVDKFGGIPKEEDLIKLGKELNILNLVEVMKEGYEEAVTDLMRDPVAQALFMELLKKRQVSA